MISINDLDAAKAIIHTRVTIDRQEVYVDDVVLSASTSLDTSMTREGASIVCNTFSYLDLIVLGRTYTASGRLRSKQYQKTWNYNRIERGSNNE